MHVLFVGGDYPPYASGVGMYMQNMAKSLALCGHKATVICSAHKNQPQVSEDDGVTVLRYLDINSLYGSATVEKILRIAEKQGVDLIEGSDHLGVAAQLFAVKEKPPILIKAHSSNALRVLRESQVFYQWQRPLLWMAYMRHVKQFFYERASYFGGDYLIAPSQAILHNLQSQGIMLPVKNGIVHNPIHFKAVSTRNSASKNSHSLLFAGRLDFGKGIEFIPGLMRNLSGTKATLEIAGEDSYARGVGSLRKWLTKRLGEDVTSVNFLGHIPSDKMAELFKRAAVVIVPSRWDNFPTVILEAMRYAVPVVASPYGGMPEMLNGTLCTICDPATKEFAAKVVQYLSNSTLAEEAGASMMEKLLKVYNPETVVSRYYSLYSGPHIPGSSLSSAQP